jgi:hypothetical protein
MGFSNPTKTLLQDQNHDLKFALLRLKTAVGYVHANARSDLSCMRRFPKAPTESIGRRQSLALHAGVKDILHLARPWRFVQDNALKN